jgi:hypothetical protein
MPVKVLNLSILECGVKPRPRAPQGFPGFLCKEDSAERIPRLRSLPAKSLAREKLTQRNRGFEPHRSPLA